jgi:hypothetical protein
MSEIKNPQSVKRHLEDADDMVRILQDIVRRNMKIDPQEAARRFTVIREKLKFCQDSISG